MVTIYRIEVLCWVIIITFNFLFANALPTANKPARFSDLLPAAELPPFDPTASDADAVLDTAEGAIDRLFETYERQFMHHLHQAAKAETQHSILRRSTFMDDPSEPEDGASWPSDAVFGSDDLLVNVDVGADNVQRSREQHANLAYGLAGQHTQQSTEEVAVTADDSPPLVVEDTEPLVHDNEISTEAAAAPSSIVAELKSAVGNVESTILSAETAALEHLAEILGSNTDVVRQMSVDVPKEDYVPLDVPRRVDARDLTEAMLAPGGGAGMMDSGLAYVTNVDAAMQYDVDNSKVHSDRRARQLLDLDDSELDERDRSYHTRSLAPYLRTNNFTYRLAHPLPGDRTRTPMAIHDDIFVHDLHAYLILFTGRSYYSAGLEPVVKAFLAQKRRMDSRGVWAVHNMTEYIAALGYMNMSSNCEARCDLFRLPESFLTGDLAYDRAWIDRLTFNRRWGATVERRLAAANSLAGRQHAYRVAQAAERQRAVEEAEREAFGVDLIEIEKENRNGVHTDTIVARLEPMPMAQPQTTPLPDFMHQSTPNWRDDPELDELAAWYVMTPEERTDTEFAAFLHALIAVNGNGPYQPFYFFEQLRLKREVPSEEVADAAVTTVMESERGKLMQTADGYVLEVKQAVFDEVELVGTVAAVNETPVIESADAVEVAIGKQQAIEVGIVAVAEPEDQTAVDAASDLLSASLSAASDNQPEIVVVAVQPEVQTAVEAASDISSAIVSDDEPATSIEIIAEVPAEESFSAPAAPLAELIETRSQLFQTDSLVPSVAESKPNNAVVIEPVEDLVLSENKLEASAQLLAAIPTADLLTEAPTPQELVAPRLEADADLEPIPVSNSNREARILGLKTGNSVQSSFDLVEGSGADSEPIQSPPPSVGVQASDSAESGESDDKPQIVSDVNSNAIDGGATAKEQSDDDEDSAESKENNDSNTAAESGRSMGDDDETDDDDSDSKAEGGVTDLLRSVAEAVHLSADLENAMQTFRDAAEESASIRQARSRPAAAGATGQVAAPAVGGVDAAAAAVAGGLAGGRGPPRLDYVSALVGYGGVVVSLSVALTVGVWVVYQRVQDARHVLVIHNV